MTQKEFRAFRKKAGVCRDCGKEDAYTMAGRTYCAECAEKDRQRKQEARKDPEKRQKMLEQHRKMVKRKKAAGVCSCCGKRLAVPGKTLCGMCLWKRRSYQYARRHEQGQRVLLMRRTLRPWKEAMRKAHDSKDRKSTQIKSRERVSAHGEVFTAEREVKAMCDLIPDWYGKVLEPACGNGNFLVEVAQRKLNAGMSAKETAKTIFGIDILPDNVKEAKKRLLYILPGTEEILNCNIVCGDFLNPETVWFLSKEALKDGKDD